MIRPSIQTVAAIHDISGYGKVSLTVVIPVLSSMGFQVCPLPTAVLSTNTEYGDFSFLDLTDNMEEMIKHWKRLNLKFDAIYSGFLGSHRQVEIVQDFINHFKQEQQLVVVDPVLGDDGHLYNSMSPAMIDSMKELIKSADVITPNLTEAALLLESDYREHVTESRLKDVMKALSEKGPEIVIISNVNKSLKKKHTYVYAYNAANETFWKITCDYLPGNYPGTGDTFASVVTGCLLQGDSLPIALDRAVQFISTSLRALYGTGRDPLAGIAVEKNLANLTAPFRPSAFEMIE